MVQKTVAILIPNLRNGGAERQAALLAASLRPRYRVLLILLSANSPTDTDPALKALSGLPDDQIVRLRGPEAARCLRLYQILRARRVDTMFCYLTRADFIGPIIGRMAGVKRIYQGLRNDHLPRWKYALELLAHPAASGIVANSHASAQSFSHFRQRDISVIPNFLHSSPSDSRAYLRKSPGLVRVVTAARFVPEKDWPTAVEAMHILTSTLPEDSERLEWLVMGHGRLEGDVRRLIMDSGLSSSTRILVNPPDTPALIATGDIYLQASASEGLPNSVMEAMEGGLAVVATCAGDTLRLLGDAGLTAPVGDARLLASHMLTLCTDPALRTLLGKKARDRVRSMCNEEKCRDAYIHLIEPSRT